MRPTICLFEDDQYWRLNPLVHFRAAYQLKCGCNSLGEKIISYYPKTEVRLHCRSFLAPYLGQRFPDLTINKISEPSCLFLNGRILADSSLPKRIKLSEDREVAYVNGESLVAAFVRGKTLELLRQKGGSPISHSDLDHLPKVEVDVKLIAYPWDIVHENRNALFNDYERFYRKRRSGNDSKRLKKFKGVSFLGAKNVYVGERSEIMPGTVLDADAGPIVIGRGVKIMPNSTIIGPVFIGDNSVVKANATIYENSTIGPMCRVGGEIEGSIIHGYSNKQHSGFLGHSYLGKWVNIGADTNTSDLKNNYGSVKVDLGKEIVDTGLQFVGLFMGDHSKSSINTMFNTGTVAGICSNVAVAGFPPKRIPSFSWNTDKCSVFELGKAIDLGRIVMARRGITMTKVEEDLFKSVFEDTENERKHLG